jgi:hypothetical protein
MTRGPKPNPPIFDRTTALALRDRYLKGETYKTFAQELNDTPSRVNRCMRQHKVISKEDNSIHWKAIMDQRRADGKRVGRKPKPPKKNK